MQPAKLASAARLHIILHSGKGSTRTIFYKLVNLRKTDMQSMSIFKDFGYSIIFQLLSGTLKNQKSHAETLEGRS
jgi:hypothetical protein